MLHLLAVLEAIRSLELQAELQLAGLNINKNRILSWAATYPGCTMSELSRGVLIDRTTLTRMLDQLESQGFITRVRSTRDRREVNIALTSDGHGAVQASVSATDRAVERYAGILEPEQVRQVTGAAFALLRASSLDRPTLRRLTGTSSDH